MNIKSIIVNIVIGIIASAVVAILVLGYESKISNYNEQISNYNEQISALHERIAGFSETRQADRHDIDAVEKKYSNLVGDYLSNKSLLTDKEKQEALSALSKFDEFLLNIQPVNLFVKKKQDARLFVSRYEKPSSIINKDELLESIRNNCGRRFLMIYAEADVYKLPFRVRSSLAEFLQNTTYDCDGILLGIDKIVEDKNGYLDDMAFYRLNLYPWHYERIAERFDAIISGAAEVQSLIRNEVRRLNEPQ